MKSLEQLLSWGHPSAFPSKELPALITTASPSQKTDFPAWIGNNRAGNARAKGKTRIYCRIYCFFPYFPLIFGGYWRWNDLINPWKAARGWDFLREVWNCAFLVRIPCLILLFYTSKRVLPLGIAPVCALEKDSIPCCASHHREWSFGQRGCGFFWLVLVFFFFLKLIKIDKILKVPVQVGPSLRSWKSF